MKLQIIHLLIVYIYGCVRVYIYICVCVFKKDLALNTHQGLMRQQTK